MTTADPRKSLWVRSTNKLSRVTLTLLHAVLEYMPGGQIEWAVDNKPLMTVDESRRVFRDVVLGLEYRKSLIVGLLCQF